jgi:hypothetical protein
MQINQDTPAISPKAEVPLSSKPGQKFFKRS